MKIFILYPNQLFKNLSNFTNKKVLLIEEPLFFTQYDFHIQKLVLHRASMKFYESYLKQNNILVEYFEDESYIELYKNEKVFVYELFDNYLEKKVYKNFLNITTIKNPNFIKPKDTNKFLHKFYINRRKELNIFMDMKYFDFKNVHYSLSYITNYTTDDEHIKAHNNGRKNAKSLLLAYIKEVEEFWEDEKIVIGTLENIKNLVKEADITKTAQILVGNFLGDKYSLSKLYDKTFTHEYREGIKDE